MSEKELLERRERAIQRWIDAANARTECSEDVFRKQQEEKVLKRQESNAAFEVRNIEAEIRKARA